MEAAAQVCIDFILSGDYENKDLQDVLAWKSACELCKHVLCIVECVIPCAEAYLDKARGAEAGEKSGRDPREAIVWRQAADFLLKMARFMFTDETGVAQNMSKNVERDVLSHGKSAAEPAEFFYLAFKHRALPDADTRQNGTRVAILYERAAELLYGKHDNTADKDTVEDVIAFYLKAIARFNSPTVVPAEELVLWETASECGKMTCDAETEDFVSQGHWLSAYCLSKEVLDLPEVKRKTKDVIVLKARVALQICAAKTTMSEALLGYETCLWCFLPCLAPREPLQNYQLFGNIIFPFLST